MSDSAVGVVGDASVADRLSDAGHSVVTGSVDDIPETDRVVAVGRAAVRAAGRADTEPLVLPVGSGRGVRSVPEDTVVAAVDAIDRARIEHHPILDVRVGGDSRATALWDVTAVTEEAARISEYTVSTATETVARFRADGLTVATPAGSTAYARRIGGPVLAPSTEMGAVVPIAPFTTNPDHWVLGLSALSVTVERDEATVALYADGDRKGTVDCGDSVAFHRTGTLRVAVVGASRSRFS